MDELEAHMAANVGSHMLALLKENKSLKKDNDGLKLRLDELERRFMKSSEGDERTDH